MNTPVVHTSSPVGLAFQTPTHCAQPLQVKCGGDITTEVTSPDHITPGVDTFRSLTMSLCPPYAPFFGFAGVASSVSLKPPSPPKPKFPPPRVLIVEPSYSSMLFYFSI